MGRKHKFSGVAMHDNERDSRAQSADDRDSSSPVELDPEARSGVAWATMQDPVGDDETVIQDTKEVEEAVSDPKWVTSSRSGRKSRSGSTGRDKGKSAKGELANATRTESPRDRHLGEIEPECTAALLSAMEAASISPERTPALASASASPELTANPEPATPLQSTSLSDAEQEQPAKGHRRQESAAKPSAAAEPAEAKPKTPGAAKPAVAKPNPAAASASNCASDQRWQELAAEAAGEEIEAMHWDQAGSPTAAAECYRQVAVKLLQAAESLEKEHAVRLLLEQRATEALERVASLEASHGIPPGAAPERRVREEKLTTQGVLASTLATNAGSAQLDDPAHKSSQQLGEGAKLLGAAAAIGGAVGLLLMGPISAAALGAGAAYATTREDATGTAAKKVCNASLGMADVAVNKAAAGGLKASDFALEEFRKKILEGLDGSTKSKGVNDWCRGNKDKCIRAVAAVEALQGALPRRKLSEEARRMKARYPDRVPVLCERGAGARSDLPEIERKKFAVPDGMLFGEFKYIVHKQVTQAAGHAGLAVDETIYLFVGESGVQPKTSATMAELYKLHGAENGFLYIRYTAENTLG